MEGRVRDQECMVARPQGRTLCAYEIGYYNTGGTSIHMSVQCDYGRNSSDTEDTHPTELYHRCHSAMWRAMTARAKGASYTTSVIMHEWQEHSSDFRMHI